MSSKTKPMTGGAKEKKKYVYQVYEIYCFSQTRAGFECKYQRNTSRQNMELWKSLPSSS